MDHELINRALHELTSIPLTDLTPEVIQGWARFICAAAGVEVESTTRIYSDWVELQASVALLASELGNARYTISLDIWSSSEPGLKAFIFTDPKITLYGYGTTAEEVLKKLGAAAQGWRRKDAAL